MGQLVFPDNTVLVNFAHINRLDILASLLQGRGTWCATVASECARSALEPGLGAMSGCGSFLGEPLLPDSPAEHLHVQVLREELAVPGDSRASHLGEAETVALIEMRALHALVITDDVGARRLASSRGIPTYTTWDLLYLACRTKLLDADTLWGYVLTLIQRERGRPPHVYDRPSFDRWLARNP